jgi:exodeoxyribonuclease III|tara:strand:- start:1373 stop:2581 length:1209 start_codon:yes stop_codon:yes gene_type:complete
MLKSWLKTMSSSSEASPTQQKRQRCEASSETCRDPCTLVTWNANGLITRAKSNSRDLQEFVREHDPDVLCVQEARVKAHCANPKAQSKSPDIRNRARPLASEAKELSPLLDTAPLKSYRAAWSLANGRHAGTLMLVHERLGRANVFCSLDAARHAIRTAASERPDGPTAPPSLDRQLEHHIQGRLQYVAFATFDLLNTYVPNRGWTDQSCRAREEWDNQVREFLLERQKLTQGRPLIWCGDHNVAHTAADSTHEDFFRAARPEGQSTEAYRAATLEKDRGMPGFSDGERSRFERLLDAGGLFDAWRVLNPSVEKDPAAAAFTWRGARAKNVPGLARYEGKAQRLDYFLLSKELEPRLKSCRVLGHGIDLIGFLGSDHCPVLLELDTHKVEDPQGRGGCSDDT